MIDHTATLKDSGASSIDEAATFLQSELPYIWLDAYVAQTARPTNVLQFQHGTFGYIYDHYAELEATGNSGIER